MPVFLDPVANYDLARITESIREGMAELGLDFTGRKTAVIKPNIVHLKTPDSGVITHPVVVEAIIDILRSQGVEDISIAEAPAIGVDTNKAFCVSGYIDLAKRKQVKLVDLFTAPRTNVPINYGYKDVPNSYIESDLHKYYCGYLSIPSIFIESDVYINCAKLKTHNRTHVTLSMKSQWGMMSFADRQQYHRIGLHEPIAHLANAVHADMTVIDGIVGIEGNGPILGTTKHVGALVLGSNMVETDITAARLVGHDPKEIIHFQHAVELGLSGWDPEVRGVRIEDLQTDFEPAPQEVTIDKNCYIWKNHRSCHLDDNAFRIARKIARRNPKYWVFFVKFAYYKLFKRLDIVRGKGCKLPESVKGQKIIVSGECARDILQNREESQENIIFIPGCPPDPMAIIKAIINL